MASRLLTRLRGQESKVKVMTSPVACPSLESTICSTDSLMEDQRLQIDHDKIFKVWEKQDTTRKETPMCSTPKRGYTGLPSQPILASTEHPARSRRESSILTFRKQTREAKSRRHVTLSDQEDTMACDSKSRVTCSRQKSLLDLQARSRSAVRQGSDTARMNSKDSVSKKRMPFRELSIGRLSDVFPRQRSRLSVKGTRCHKASSVPVGSPRPFRDITNMRVANEDQKDVTVTLDESMVDFLSNVNMENFKDFLQFYSKVTSDISRSACNAVGYGLIRDESSTNVRNV